MKPFVVSTASNPEELRSNLAEDGYLFLRNLAPRQKLLALRREVLDILQSAGWINPTDGSDRAIWSGVGPFTEGEPQYMTVYQRVINAPLFRAWADDPAFIDLIRGIIGAQVHAHRLRIGRITFPNNVEQTTAAHQDFHYIRGSAETYTIWTPIGDCPVQLGGLAVLRGSHRTGFIDHALFEGKKYANRGLRDDQLPSGEQIEWHTGDFAAGDVLVFHSHTVHKALPNLTADQLRLSTDNRYTRVGDRIEDLSTKSHYGL